MERSDAQKQVETYLATLFAKSKEALEDGRLVEVSQVFDKPTYMQFLWQINSLSHSSDEIKNCYRVLRLETAKLVDGSIRKTVEAYQQGEADTSGFISRVTALIANVKGVERMVGRFFCYFDKKEMQCTNFLDETSSELIRNQFFDNFMLKYKAELFRAIKEATGPSVFKQPDGELVRFLDGLSYFLGVKDRKRNKYCEELMKRMIAVVNDEILAVMKELPGDIYDRLRFVHKLNKTIVENSAQLIPPLAAFDYLREALLGLIDSTLVDQLRRDFLKNTEALTTVFGNEDTEDLRMLVELVRQADPASLVYFKEPFKNFMIQIESAIISHWHENSEELVGRLILFFKSCNEKITGVFERDTNLIFARNKAIECMMQENLSHLGDNIPVASLITSSLLRYVTQHIAAYSGGGGEHQVEQEFEPVVDILSYTDSKEFFKDFNKFFIARLIDTNHLRELNYERAIIGVFERKLGETVLGPILSVYNEIAGFKAKQTAFETFRDAHSTKKGVEFNITQVSQKDIEPQTVYRQTQQFMYFSGLYSTYFGLDRANQNKKYFMSFELGHAELDYEVNGKKYTIAAKPVYALMLFRLMDLKPRTIGELARELAQEPFASDPAFKARLEGLLGDLTSTKLVVQLDNQYKLNEQFSSAESDIVLGTEGFFHSAKRATEERESRAEKSLEYESKIMKIIKQVKNMSVREIEEYLSNTTTDFNVERCREALGYLLDRELVLRHYQKADLIIFK